MKTMYTEKQTVWSPLSYFADPTYQLRLLKFELLRTKKTKTNNNKKILKLSPNQAPTNLEGHKFAQCTGYKNFLVRSWITAITRYTE